MTNEQLRNQFVPVIVGEKSARSLAARLFGRYGLASHLLTTRPPLLRRLRPWLCVHALPDHVGLDVLLLALGDLAEELAAKDRTPLLFWCATELPAPDDEQRAMLESQMIVCNESALDDLAHVALQGGLTL